MVQEDGAFSSVPDMTQGLGISRTTDVPVRKLLV